MNEIQKIYEKTATQLSIWSKADNQRLRNVACAPSLRSTQYNFGNATEAGPAKIGDEVGFSILWTPPVYEAEILLCGACVTTFGDIETNRRNLAGQIPVKNICMSSEAKFHRNLRSAFSEVGKLDLLENCVGMNVWHAQKIGSVVRRDFPEEAAEFFETNTKQIIELLKPKRVIALGGESFKALSKNLSGVKKFYHPSTHLAEFKQNLADLIDTDF